MSYLSWAVPTSVVVLFALFKISMQAGRIEQGVKGLYRRMDRVEHHIFRVRGGQD
jgi:hypothetical protein